jgi:serine/threonine protein phosphatase PrpC
LASRKYGVTSEPETKIFHLSSEDDFIILGSDGLFDYVKDSELCAWVRRWLGEEIPKDEIPMRLAE